MKLSRLADEPAVSAAVIQLLREVLESKPEANLVLPTGRTPLRLYRDMVAQCIAGTLDLSRARIFQLDELLGVAPDDQRSYRAFLRRGLLDQVQREPGREFLLDGSTEDPAGDVTRLRDELQAHGGADLMLLGLGRNGHVALNEPGSTRDTEAGVAKLHDTTFQAVQPLFERDACPTHGMTLGMTDIVQSKRICLMVLGASKAVILRSVLTEPPTPRHPASLLRDLPAFQVLADEDACTLLPPDFPARTAQV